MSGKKFWLILGTIMIVGAVLRFWGLGEFPMTLNRDEAAIGYNAYALLKSGHDEHGVAWPINVESFGDWKLPVYIYLTVPMVAVFGLSAWSIKLPSALAGVAIIALVALLMRQLVNNYPGKDEQKAKNFTKKADVLALVTAGVVALMPWAIHLSRLTYEANVAMMFFLLGWWLVEKYKGKVVAKTTRHWWQNGLFLGGILSLGITLLTYHSYQAVLPLWILLMWGFNWRWSGELWRRGKATLAVMMVLVLVVGGVLLAGKTGAASTTKLSGLSIFEAAQYAPQQFLERQALTNAEVPKIIQSLYVNKFWLMGRQFASNLLTTFSANFNFVKGGSHGIHNVSNLANLYLFEVIFMLAGLAVFVREKRPWQVLIFGWLLVAAVAPAMTIEPNHSIRFAAALGALAIFVALGIVALVNWRPVLKWPLGILYLFAIFYFCVSYFIVAPRLDIRNSAWIMEKAAAKALAEKDNYDQVILRFRKESPYIYMLFQSQYPPENLASHLKFLPPDYEGFTYAESLENVYFGEADWTALEAKEPAPKILHILDEEQISTDRFETGDYRVLEKWQMPGDDRSIIVVEYLRLEKEVE